MTRVLTVAHNCVLRSNERQRFEVMLRQCSGISLTLVVPAIWKEDGRLIRAEAAHPDDRVTVRAVPIKIGALPRVKWYAHFYPSLRQVMKDIQPDVIHVWEEPWSVVAWQVARFRDQMFPNAALVLETEQNLLRRYPPPFEALRRSTLNKVDFLVGRQSESIGVSGYQGPTKVIGWGVDREVFYPTRQLAPNIHDQLHIGYVGRLVEQKGLDEIIDALCQTPNVKVSLMGAGQYDSHLQKKVERYGLGDRVLFLPPGRAENVAKFLNSLDILVLMSRTTKTWKEQFGRVIIEAQACRVPVIGSDSGAIPEVVGPGGWIVKERDTHQLANLLNRLNGDRDEVTATAECAFRYCTTRFDLPIIASETSDILMNATRMRRATYSHD